MKMSDLDIYHDTENLISSDEYSEEDDDDLMNTAVSSHNTPKSEVTDRSSAKYLSSQGNSKMKEIKLLIKRKKFAGAYKKRSIKWLNNRKKREKYKQHLLDFLKKNGPVLTPLIPTILNPTAVDLQLEKELEKVKEIGGNAKSEDKTESDTIEIDDTDVESPQKTEPLNEKPLQNPISLQKLLIESKEDESQKEEKLKNVANEDLQKMQTDQIEVTENKVGAISAPCNKRPRTPSPTLENDNNNQAEQQEPEKSTSPLLYKEINEMFPKYDEIVGRHIKSTNSTVDAIETNMTRILLDIQTINDVLQAKEIEWNRLLHLKKVKEEILTRLVRKKHIVEMKEKQASDEQKYTLPELKELEMYLSETHPTGASTTTCNTLTSNVQQLVENRANMKREDLERERKNTNRLQSILVSSNILPRADNSNNHFSAAKDNMVPKNNATIIEAAVATKNQQFSQSYQYLENKSKSNVGRQGAFRDVKSIIADFRQQNPELLPRVGKRIKLNEPITNSIRNLNKSASISQPIDEINNLSIEPTYDSGSGNYTPTLEKLLSASLRSNDSHIKRSTPYSQGFKFNNDGQTNYYRLQSSSDELCNEVSITPVSHEKRYSQKGHEYKAELLRSALHSNIPQNVVYVDAAEYEKQNFKDVEDNDTPVCQECKSHEARFVCAGCGNQWYCSRNCQITAWDKHSETCNE